MLTPATILLSALALAPFLRSLHGEFLFDDAYLFDDGFHLDRVYWTVREFRGDARSMVHFFDYLLFRIFRTNQTGKDATGTVIIQPAAPWHVLSFAFHLGATLAVWGLASLILEPWRAWAAAAIFAVHPLQVSAVCYVSARAGVQAWFFSALGLLHAVAGGWHWSLVPLCSYFAYKSKPDGILYVLLYPLVWFAK